MKKRILSAILALVIVVGLMPLTAVAAEDEVAYTCASGEAGTGTLRDAVDAVQTAGGGTITLLRDVEVTGGNLQISSAAPMDISVHGNGHTITLTDGEILLGGQVTLNLGEEGETQTLTITSTDDTRTILDVQDSATLNLYEHVTLGPSRAGARPGGVHLGNNSVFHMYGGKISACVNWGSSVTGAVYLTGSAQFTMYDGVIENCSGWAGGAVGVGGGFEIGGGGASGSDTAVFTMEGGIIQNCTDYWHGGGAVYVGMIEGGASGTFCMKGGVIRNCFAAGGRDNSGVCGFGGGAVCLYSSDKVSFIMDGGRIENCGCPADTEGSQLGGAVFVYASNSQSKVAFNGGTITKNSANEGGGLYLYRGNVTMKDGFRLYDNTAAEQGDDICRMRGSTSLTLGAADPACVLAATHGHIDGWYQDSKTARWAFCYENGFTIPATSSTLSIKAAHGELPPIHTVTFDANDASGNTDTANAQDGTSLGEAMPADPTRDGYSFKGWNTAPDGSGTAFTAQSVVDADVTVYAQWEKESGGNGGGMIPVSPFLLNEEAHYAYLAGYSDGTVRPAGQITRGEVATIFFRLLNDDTRAAYRQQTSGYTDVTSGMWFYDAVSTLSSMGIIEGYSDGAFRPNAPITRAEFAKIAVQLLQMDETDTQGTFCDVAAGKWYAPYVEAAAQAGLIYGSEGRFRPNDNITRAEACVIVNRLLGRHPHKDHLLPSYQMIEWPDCSIDAWYYADMMEATNSHTYTRMATAGYVYGSESWTGRLSERNR